MVEVSFRGKSLPYIDSIVTAVTAVGQWSITVKVPQKYHWNMVCGWDAVQNNTI